METALQVEASARVPADGVEDMLDFKVALRATRVPKSGEVSVDLTVSSQILGSDALVVEDVTLDMKHLDRDVLCLRIGSSGVADEPWTRFSGRYSVERAHAFRYVALMYGQKGGALELVTVKLIEDV